MAVEYKFGGSYKVIKGETYPIKRADLERALEEAGVTDLEEISYVSVKSASPKGDPVASIWMTGEAIIPGMWMKRSPSLIISTFPFLVSFFILLLKTLQIRIIAAGLSASALALGLDHAGGCLGPG